jgi:hypothetical protein
VTPWGPECPTCSIARLPRRSPAFCGFKRITDPGSPLPDPRSLIPAP